MTDRRVGALLPRSSQLCRPLLQEIISYAAAREQTAAADKCRKALSEPIFNRIGTNNYDKFR